MPTLLSTARRLTMDMCRTELHRTSGGWVAAPEDLEISENHHVRINLTYRTDRDRRDGLIIMLHGLNERSWDKYSPWADELCTQTGMAVAMMPTAFHIDRGKPEWSRIRSMKPLEQQRKGSSRMPKSVSFINAALSDRIDRCPQRFVTSAYQTMEDVIDFIKDIRLGGYEPIICRNTTVHLFGYSIGCSIAQALSISSGELFGSASRSVFFCGGSALTDARPVSPYILDAEAFEQLDSYLRTLARGNTKGLPTALVNTPGLQALRMLCASDYLKDIRHQAMNKHARKSLYVPMEGDAVFTVQLVRDFLGSLPAALEPFSPDYPHDHVRPFGDYTESQGDFEQLFNNIADWYASASGHRSSARPRAEASVRFLSAAVPTHP